MRVIWAKIILYRHTNWETLDQNYLESHTSRSGAITQSYASSFLLEKKDTWRKRCLTIPNPSYCLCGRAGSLIWRNYPWREKKFLDLKKRSMTWWKSYCWLPNNVLSQLHVPQPSHLELNHIMKTWQTSSGLQEVCASNAWLNKRWLVPVWLIRSVQGQSLL